MKIQELKDKLPGLLAKADAYNAAAIAENRVPTDEEQKGFEDTMKLYEATEKQIAMMEQTAAAQARLDAPGPRRVAPDMTPAPQGGSAATVVTGGDKPGASKGTGGFQSLGEMALSVRAARIGGQFDPRLRSLVSRPQNAASTFGSEAVGADGGFAIPPDFRTTIAKKVQGEASLLSLADQYETAANEVILPTDEATPWATTGGIQVAWLGEGSTIPGSKPALQQFQIRTNKIGAFVTATDELLQDAQVLTGYIENKVPDKMTYALNAAIVGGTGVGQPQGIIGAASVVSQTIVSGQTLANGGFVYTNATSMYSRMYDPLRKDGIWIANQDIEPLLFSMVVPGGSPAFPAYMPPGGLADKPYGTLFGRPIYYSEACSAIGTPGDIMFVNMKQYATAVKTGGVRSDVSIHLYFDADQTVFRFIMRIGGLPWWKTSIPRAKSALPLSWAVTLAVRT